MRPTSTALIALLILHFHIFPNGMCGESIEGAEYFIGSDPGPGAAIPILADFSSGAEDVTVEVPSQVLDQLPPGLHALSVRFRSNYGAWSFAEPRFFIVDEKPIGESITAAEYFIGADPGPHAAIPILADFSSGVADVLVAVPIPVLDQLPPGLHVLSVRFRSNDGAWSFAEPRFFIIYEGSLGRETKISRIEYQWHLDGYPAAAPMSAIADPPRESVIFDELAPMEGFVEGRTYQLVVTPYDETGRRGISVTHEVLYQPVHHDPPSVEITGVSEVSENGTTISGLVSDDGGDPVVERGFVYAPAALHSAPEIGVPGVGRLAGAGGVGVYALRATGLEQGTLYAVRAYAINAVDVGYSVPVSFFTDTRLTLESTGLSSVENRAFAAGESQRFLFDIADPRSLRIVTAGAVGFQAELLNEAGEVLASHSGSGPVDLEKVVLAGSYTLRLTNGGTTNEVLSVVLDASNPALARPSVSFARSSLVSLRARRVRGFASVSNQGNLPEALSVRATRGNGLFRVNYFAPGNATASLLAGTYRTPILGDSGAASVIRATVSPNKKRLTRKRGTRTTILRKTFSLVLHANSTSDTALGDTASLRVRTR